MGNEDRLSELVPSEAEQASDREMELDLLQRALNTDPEDGPAAGRVCQAGAARADGSDARRRMIARGPAQPAM